jgi:signal recognition particle protein
VVCALGWLWVLSGLISHLSSPHVSHTHPPPCHTCSALHFAAAVGATKCVKLLLDAGADPDLQDREGYTPLHMAAGYMQVCGRHVAGSSGCGVQGLQPMPAETAGWHKHVPLQGLQRTLPGCWASVVSRAVGEQSSTWHENS